MTDPFLLSRIRLCFNSGDADPALADDLSAGVLTPEGNLWLGSDEGIGLERLVPTAPSTFGQWQHYPLNPFLPALGEETEIDIEGLDYSEGYLWLVGSHSTKRKKAKEKDEAEDIERLASIKAERNRYLLARLPIVNGEPLQSYTLPEQRDRPFTAASLQTSRQGNILIDALVDDPHLGRIVASGLPSKENGFDIEGLAVRGDRVFLGLRGPVLRGWAVLLELQVREKQPGVLGLNPCGEDGALYKKHFLGLDGLGVRELCWWHDKLLVLAGPTLDTDGALRVFELGGIFAASGNTLSGQSSGRLKRLFDLPIVTGADKAEGLTLVRDTSGEEALMVIYDSPAATRKPEPEQVYADVFRLPTQPEG